MAQNNDDNDIKWLYGKLKAKGYDIGSEADFKSSLANDADRKWYYDKAKGMGLDMGSMADFENMYKPKQAAPAVKSQQQKPQATAPATSQPQKDKPLTATDRQKMLDDVGNMVARTNVSLQQTKNRMGFAMANAGLNVPRVTIGGENSGVRLGQNRKVVAKKPKFNAQSGKPEQTYITESGNEYSSRGEADLEQNGIDEARFQTEQQEAYLLREKRRIEQEMERRGSELDAEADGFSWRDIPRGSGGAIHTYNSSTVNGRFADERYKALQAQLNKVNDGLATLAEAKKGKASDRWIDDSSNWASKKGKQLLAFGAGAWRGLVHSVGKVSTWDMGMTDMATNGSLYSAAVDADKKGMDNIDPEYRDLLNLTAYTNAIEGENAKYIGRGYKAGTVTGESLPFMIEMMLNPASNLGPTAVNKMMREAVKRYGKEAVKKAAKKYLAAKIGTRLIGDAAGSAIMAGTTGQGRVVADALNRLTGDVKFKVDDSGKIVYDGREGAEDSALKAYLKAFGAQTIENHSEMVGEYFAPFLGKVSSLTRKGMEKIGLGKVNKLIDDIGATGAAKMIGDFEKHTKWNGTFGEYAEEVVGNIENALLVGDNTLDTAEGTGVFNLDQNIDTFLGVGLMGGFFAGAKTLSYRGPKRQALKEMSDAGKVIEKAVGGNYDLMDMWGGWRNTFLVGTDEEKKAALREVMDNTDLPINFRMGVLNFVKAAQKYEGIARAQESKVRNGEQDPVAQAYDESFDNGYDCTDPAAMDEARYRLDERRGDVARLYGINEEDVDSMIGDDPLGFIDKQRQQGATDNELQTVMDYGNAKSAVDGMVQRVQDDADDAMENKRNEARANVERHTHKDLGVVQPATMKVDDKPVYIVKGNVALFPDGSGVDVRNSDQSIVVCDAETGEYKFISPDQLLNVGEAIDPQSEIDEAFANIQAEHDAVLGGMVNEENVQNEGENAHYSVNEESLEGEHGSSPEDVKGDMRRYAEATAAFLNGEIGEIGYLKALDYNEEWLTGEATVEEIAREARAQAGDFSRFLRRGTAHGEAAGQPTALERVPVDENTGEPMFERVDKETALDALNEVTGGNAANTTAIVNAQVEQAQKTLDALKKKQPTKKLPTLKGSPMAMLKAQQEADAKYTADMEQYNAQVAAAEEKLGAWSRIYSLMNERNRAVREQREAEQRERDRQAHDAAVAQVEEQKRIAAEKAAEQAEVGTHAVNPKIKAKWDGAAKVEGNAITLADGSTIRGHYIFRIGKPRREQCL